MRVRQISQGVEDISWKKPVQDEEPSVLAAPIVVDDVPAAVIAITPADTAGPVETPDTDMSTAPPAGLVPDVSTAQVDAEHESSEKDTGLKRKFLERGTSEGPPDHTSGEASSEQLKRPREDANQDGNPRETKRPTPPPSPTIKAPKPVCTDSL